MNRTLIVFTQLFLLLLLACNGEEQHRSEASPPRIEPAYVEGQMVGVRLNEILPDSLFAKAQLNPGDIIISVNGISVDTTSSDSGVLAALVEAEEWILRVRSPDGSERDVSISLRDSD